MDDEFGAVGTFVYMFKAHGKLSYVEYQFAGPNPNPDLIEKIESGNSQEAATIGSGEFTANNITATVIGLRSPAYLNTVFDILYHIHFLADDRSVLGHVTAFEADSLDIEWARIEAIGLRYWDTR